MTPSNPKHIKVLIGILIVVIIVAVAMEMFLR